MKSNDLRKLVQAQLKTVCDHVFYELATDNAMYPHCVFEFSTIDLGDLSRDDVMLTIDVWDKNASQVRIENLCDSIEKLFNCVNLPQESILPTFYRVNRMSVRDDVKSIRHRVLKFQIQNYERN